MAFDSAILRVSADVDNDGVVEDGVFEITSGINVSIGTRSGLLIDGAGSQVNSIIAHWYEKLTGEQLRSDGKRAGFYLDLGAGQHIVELDFMGYQGGDGQWGNSADPNVQTAASATGAPVFDQMEVLDRYLQIAEIDSRNPATLEIGGYSTGGRFGGPLDVVVESPLFTFDSESQSSVFSGSITFIEAATLAEAYDAVDQRE